MFLFPISSALWSIKKYFRTSHLRDRVRSSTKIIEFDNVKFRKSVSSEDGGCREFPKTDSNSIFSKKWVIQNRKFSNPFFSVNNPFFFYNSVVVAIQIYFSPTFVKLWVHTSDNIAGVELGPQYY